MDVPQSSKSARKMRQGSMRNQPTIQVPSEELSEATLDANWF